MALSNIFREPRREITETAVGIVAIGVFISPILATWHWEELNFAWLLIIVLVLFLPTIFFIIGAHAIGEDICDALERRGIHLRPRRRH